MVITADNAANVAIIESLYEAFGRGDIATILANMTDDVVFKTNNPPSVPWHGEYHGKEGVAQFFNAIGSNCTVLSFTPELFTANMDRVVSVGKFGCRANSTGIAAESSWVFLWKLRDGLVYEYEQFHDNALDTIFNP